MKINTCRVILNASGLICSLTASWLLIVIVLMMHNHPLDKTLGVHAPTIQLNNKVR